MPAETTPAPAARFTLRQLPLPAKLVLTLFLLTVGLGYTSAMVQLHMQHSDRDGTTLPTPANVVAVFAGKVWKEARKDGDPRVVSQLEAIISGDPHGNLTGKNMTPAFFDHDESTYHEDVKKDPQTDAKRHGERLAIIDWINTAPDGRQKEYDADRFALTRAQAQRPITDGYLTRDDLGTSFVKIKTIIDQRCARCHQPGGEKGSVPLTTYEELAKYIPVDAEVPEGGGWVNSGKQMGLEKLTQSTHAHLLSFAVLFTLTGLTFAFSGYPGWIRGIVGPVVLLAQVSDVACWWLARLPNVGPYFAMAIIGTGAVVGMGLGAQIVLSLFNMYGPKGKVGLVLLFAVAAAGGGAAYTTAVKPYLDAEKDKAETRKAADAKKAAEEKKKADEERKKAEEAKNNAPKKADRPKPATTDPARLEVLFTGPWKDAPWAKDGTVPPGGMVRAFFDKESEFKDALKAKAPELPRLTEERETERAAFVAWVKSSAADRRKAYDADNLALPPALAGKPLTAEFVADGKGGVKLKTMIEARCASCHGGESKIPLDSFEKFEKYFAPGGK